MAVRVGKAHASQPTTRHPSLSSQLLALPLPTLKGPLDLPGLAGHLCLQQL